MHSHILPNTNLHHVINTHTHTQVYTHIYSNPHTYIPTKSHPHVLTNSYIKTSTHIHLQALHLQIVAQKSAKTLSSNACLKMTQMKGESLLSRKEFPVIPAMFWIQNRDSFCSKFPTDFVMEWG
jgi:hypothetical protein